MKDSSITKNAYAKINLTLDVTGRLENGYHTVKMIMESISLHDVITIACVNEPGVRMTCSRPDLSCGEDNLVMRAARAVLPEDAPGIEIHLEKNIPMAAGMAGGSTDAAAVLTGLNELLELGLDERQLCDIGVRLGADIPYCILGGSRLAEGIGEVLTSVPKPPKMHIAVIKPNIDVSTKFVYEHLDTDGVKVHPDTDGMIACMETGDCRGMCERLGNVLRDVTVKEYPVIAEIENKLVSLGACGALMSGSGPSVFGLFDDGSSCQNAVEVMKREYPDMFAQEAEFIL